MIWGEALAQAGNGVRHIVEARAGQCLVLEPIDGFMPRGATVFEGGGRASRDGDETAEPRGHGVAGPRLGHADPATVDMLESEGAVGALLVPGLDSQDGPYLARAHADTAVDPPEEAVGEGRPGRGQALKRTGGCDAHQAQSCPPMDDGLRTRWCVEAEDGSQETEDTTDGATADARHPKAWQGHVDQVPLGPDDALARVVLKLTQWRPGLFEGSGGLVALGAEARDLVALVALVVAALLGVVFPWLSTVGDVGKLTHHVRSSSPVAAGDRGRWGLRASGSQEDRALGAVLHPGSERSRTTGPPEEARDD